MLDPSWALTRPLLWLALVGLVVLLVLRSVRKDRKEYQRFKRYRTTAKRQAMFRKWLLSAFLSFGGLSVVILLLAGAYVEPLLRQLQDWQVLRDIRSYAATDTGPFIAIVVGVVVALTALTVIGIVAARSEPDVMTIGDIRAMLPRNRQELGLGAAMSINAGVVEELLFRLALPALLYGASGSAAAAVIGSVIFFGGLHVYQGAAGIIGTTIVGALMFALYVVFGTIVAPIVAHALFDLRSLVLLPVGLYSAHRVDGRVTKFITMSPKPKAVKPVDAKPEPTESVEPTPEPEPTS